MKVFLTLLIVLVELTSIKGQIAESSYHASKNSSHQIKINFYFDGKFSETSAEVPKSGTGTWKFEKDTLTLQRNRPPFTEQFVFEDSLTLISISKINRLSLRKRERGLRNGQKCEYNYTKKGRLTSINTYDENSLLRSTHSFRSGGKDKWVHYNQYGKRIGRIRIYLRKRYKTKNCF